MVGPDWGSRAAEGSVFGEPPPEGEADPLGAPEDERYLRPQLLGVGGMGRVDAVVDARLGREVARKQLHPALRDDPGARARFLREVRITARLDHPGIVPVMDAGRAADGTPWYTMRLVRGRSLEDTLVGLDSRARLALVPRFLAACEAVAHAHAHGVVHRDLKPANLMLGPFGETQVVDWGLARELDDDAPPPGAALGTPGWMSPEQVRGAPADRRSDVWALGRVLLALLDGRCPPPDAAPPDAPPDLAAIARRATAPAPDDRYADAAALAADVDAWLDGRRVSAHAYSPWDLALRLIAAWRAPLLVGAVAAVLLSAAVAVGWARTAVERDRALQAEHAMRDVVRGDHVEQAVDALVDGDLGAAAEAAAAALDLGDDPGARGVVAALDAFGPHPRRLLDMAAPDCERVALDPTGATFACGGHDGVALWTVGTDAPAWHVELPALDVVRPDPVGPVVVTLLEGAVTLDAADGHERGRDRTAVMRGLARGAAAVAGVDGERLWRAGEPDVRCATPATAYDVGERGGRFVLPCTDDVLVIAAGDDVHRVPVPGGLVAPVTAAVLADGTVLVGTVHGDVVHVDPDSGRVLARATVADGPVRRLRPSPDGRLLAVAGERTPVRLVATSSLVLVGGLPDLADDLAWRADGALVTLGTRVRAWAFDGDVRWGAVRADAGLDGLAVADDGVVTLHDGSGDVVAVAPDGRRIARVRWQEGVVKHGEHRGDRFVAVGMLSAGVRRFARPAFAPLPPLGELQLRHVTVLDDTTYLAARWDGGVQRLREDGGSERLLPELVLAGTSADAAGRRWLAFGDPGGLVLVDGDQERWRRGGAFRGALSADGRVVWATDDDTLLRLDADDGRELGRWTIDGTISALAIAPDGALAAVGRLDGRVEVRDADGRVHAVLAGHGERIAEIRFAVDVLLTAGWDGVARRWSLAPITTPIEGVRASLAARRGAWSPTPGPG